MAFVHLHNHTEYSLLDGLTHIKDMVRRAAELLGRRMGLFSESVERPEAPVIVDDVPGGEEGDG